MIKVQPYPTLAMVMLNSLALTDALLCLIAAWLASKNTLAVGYRMALTMLAVPALLGFLRFSGIYPLETWHPLFTLLSASAAMPLLAICVLAPQSVVATRKQFAIIFLGVTMLLGLANCEFMMKPWVSWACSSSWSP